MLSSSDVVTVRGVREIVLRHFRPDHALRPELHLRRAPLVDTEPVQAYLRELLTDVGRGAHYAPHCDDVGHLSAHTGNTNNNGMFEFVRSDDESDILVRVAILRGVRSDNH